MCLRPRSSSRSSAPDRRAPRRATPPHPWAAAGSSTDAGAASCRIHGCRPSIRRCSDAGGRSSARRGAPDGCRPSAAGPTSGRSRRSRAPVARSPPRRSAERSGRSACPPLPTVLAGEPGTAPPGDGPGSRQTAGRARSPPPPGARRAGQPPPGLAALVATGSTCRATREDAEAPSPSSGRRSAPPHPTLPSRAAGARGRPTPLARAHLPDGSILPAGRVQGCPEQPAADRLGHLDVARPGRRRDVRSTARLGPRAPCPAAREPPGALRPGRHLTPSPRAAASSRRHRPAGAGPPRRPSPPRSAVRRPWLPEPVPRLVGRRCRSGPGSDLDAPRSALGRRAARLPSGLSGLAVASRAGSSGS